MHFYIWPEKAGNEGIQLLEESVLYSIVPKQPSIHQVETNNEVQIKMPATVQGNDVPELKDRMPFSVKMHLQLGMQALDMAFTTQEVGETSHQNHGGGTSHDAQQSFVHVDVGGGATY